MESFYNFVNLFLKMIFMGTICFYTTWGLLILALYSFGLLKNFQSSIFLILLTLFTIGNIITYIHPRVIVIPYIKRTISGKVLKLFNLFFHVLPLVMFLIFYDTKVKSDNLYLAVVSLLIYLICFNPISVYNYNCDGNDCLREKIANILILIFMVFIGFLIVKQKKQKNLL